MMIDLQKKGFNILLDGERIGIVFAKNLVDAFEEVKKSIQNGIIKTDGTAIIKLEPFKKENVYDN